ncbi:unnamed protein product [Chrysoparadoxa australica]
MRGNSVNALFVLFSGALLSKEVDSCVSLNADVSHTSVALATCDAPATVTWSLAGGVSAESASSIVDIVVVIDESGSVKSGCYNPGTLDCYNDEKSFTINLVNTLAMDAELFNPNGLAGYVEFATNVNGYDTHDNFVGFETAVNGLSHSGGQTALGAAINQGRTMLEAVPDRATHKQVLVVITDGVENRGGDPTAEANAARTAGIAVYAVGVGNVSQATMLGVAGSSSNYFPVSDFSALNDALIADIVELIEVPCATNAELDIQLGPEVVLYGAPVVSEGTLVHVGDSMNWQLDSVGSGAPKTLTYAVDICSCDRLGDIDIHTAAVYTDSELHVVDLTSTLDMEVAVLDNVEPLVCSTPTPAPTLAPTAPPTPAPSTVAPTPAPTDWLELNESSVLQGRWVARVADCMEEGPWGEKLRDGLERAFGVSDVQVDGSTCEAISEGTRRGRRLTADDEAEVVGYEQASTWSTTFLSGAIAGSSSTQCAKSLLSFTQFDRFALVAEELGLDLADCEVSAISFSQSTDSPLVKNLDTSAAKGALIAISRGTVGSDGYGSSANPYGMFALALLVLLAAWGILVAGLLKARQWKQQSHQPERKFRKYKHEALVNHDDESLKKDRLAEEWGIEGYDQGSDCDTCSSVAATEPEEEPEEEELFVANRPSPLAKMSEGFSWLTSPFNKNHPTEANQESPKARRPFSGSTCGSNPLYRDSPRVIRDRDDATGTAADAVAVPQRLKPQLVDIIDDLDFDTEQHTGSGKGYSQEDPNPFALVNQIESQPSPRGSRIMTPNQAYHHHLRFGSGLSNLST